VALTWARVKDDGVERLKLRWEEIDGPAVSTPSRQGFGSRLITGGLARELGGEVRLDYPPTGVVCTITSEFAKPGEPSRFTRGAA
jgi:two-component sensor histidine kinase